MLFGSGQHVRDADAAHPLQLVPVAEELVAIDGGGQVEALSRREEPAQLHLLVIAGDVVAGRGGVAPVRIAVEVLAGEAQIGLVAELLRAAQLELHRLVDAGTGVAGEAQLGHPVLEIEAGGAAAVEALETVGLELVALEQPAEPLARVAHRGMGPGQALVAGRQMDAAAQRAGNRGGDVVQRAAVGVGTLADRARALAHLEALHAAGGRRVVGGGRGVGGRRDEHAVLQQGDLLAAVDAGAADADVGAETVALLLLDVDARHLAQDAVHVGIGLAGDVVRGQEVRRARGPCRLLGRAYDQEPLEQPFGSVRFGWLRPGALLGLVRGPSGVARGLPLAALHRPIGRAAGAGRAKQGDQHAGADEQSMVDGRRHENPPRKRRAGPGARPPASLTWIKRPHAAAAARTDR